MEKKHERNTGLDVLRVIACFMVVFPVSYTHLTLPTT